MILSAEGTGADSRSAQSTKAPIATHYWAAQQPRLSGSVKLPPGFDPGLPAKSVHPGLPASAIY
jgi:hypothetical protein